MTILNAPFGARYFMTDLAKELGIDLAIGLNAPFSAQCLWPEAHLFTPRKKERLNAPFGALFFMTVISEPDPTQPSPCLNAPFGARCFMTGCD